MHKLLLYSSVSIVLLAFLVSCGGVIGHIERYSFHNITRDSLKAIVAGINAAHPELKDFNTAKYKEGTSKFGDGDYYCRIRESGKDIILVYAYPIYPVDTITEITLTSGGDYNSILPLAKNISSTKQKYYRQLFEKYFIDYINAELEK